VFGLPLHDLPPVQLIALELSDLPSLSTSPPCAQKATLPGPSPPAASHKTQKDTAVPVDSPHHL
jgi:hypothetical protein